MDSTTTVTENTMNKPEYKKTGLGERLKSARKAMKLSEKEAAARLHLSVNLITLLENENFADGPPVTFMRGYLRSYAKLLNLSEDEISQTLTDLENSIPSSTSTIIPVTLMKPQKNNERYLQWLTYVIVLVLIVLVSVWWSSHSRYVIADVPPTQQATETKPAVTTTQPAPVEPAPSATTTVTTETPAPAATPTAAPAPTPDAAATMTPAASSIPAAAALLPETTPAITPAIPTPAPAAAPEEKKPAKKRALSTMMAIPEPS